ncbi:MAG TPA: penicillin acylase family protein [Smithella sp.]|nr:penicillin acylase family protein [Smithella sp.]
MNSHPSTRLSRFQVSVVLIIILCFVLSSCTSLINSKFKDTLPATQGVQTLPGLSDKVTVKRDNMGIPFIEANNVDDLLFAMGYVSACDRFSQMEGYRLLGQGRISEMAGAATLNMDIYMRALNLKKVAGTLYESASPDLKHKLDRYADGVNAYLTNAPTPASLTLSGHKPEPWKPIDSVYVFVVLTLGLSENLHQEIDILNIAQKVGPDKLAWLFPIYPDEPLPFEEMEKLKGVDLTGAAQDIERLFTVSGDVNRILVPAAAASNNWVVSGSRTKSGKPIFANDTHLPLSMPSIWMMMHVKCPEVQGAGISLAGVPGIVAGYNGSVAYGMTMVMADNQDLFLEKLKREPDGLYYLYKDQWLKAASREELFHIKGQKDITRTIYETRHGVLLNGILNDEPLESPDLVPLPLKQSMGVALSWSGYEPDHTMDIFFKMMLSKTADEAFKYAKEQTSIIPLNMVMADKNDIAWQVTGRYPLRKKGRGLCPSPGWNGDYDWNGYLDPSLHPSSKNPEKGYIGTANNRTVPIDFPYILTSNWYYPDRAERIDQMMKGKDKYTVEDAKAMQLDIYSPFVRTIKAALLDETTLNEMTAVWQKSEKRKNAEKALEILRNFDGNMRADSAGAAFCGVFMSSLSGNLFADELGGPDSIAYKSLKETYLLGYSALHDHLTERCKSSPFWRGKRSEILAKTVLDAVDILEKRYGNNPEKWQWGALHTYHWQTNGTKLADHMSFIQKESMKYLSGYFDRGPYPAAGDHTTLNVAAYHPGTDYDVWLIPEMRIIADFGSDEPLIGINSTGQSDNPASPNYDDGITAWREGRYNDVPFKEENINKLYTKTLTLLPKQ